MKLLRKLLCAIIIVVLSMSFAGCEDTPPDESRLTTPQNVSVSDGGLITWDAVENAASYIVILNGYSYAAPTNSYQVGSVVNDFTYSVYAVAQSGYKDSEATELQTFKGKGVPVVVDPFFENLTISISGSQLVGSGREASLTATVSYPDGNKNNSRISWSVVEGGEYGKIDGSGKFTAEEVTEDHNVTVRATSIDNENKYADFIICVASRPVLTDAMLDTIKDDIIGFDGYMDIDLYTFGLYERFERTVTFSGISTQMNGNVWHASYVDNSTGYTNELYYKNVEENDRQLSKQVALSLMNGEEYYPMTDDYGNEISWADAALYNNFKNVNVSDFKFDEEDWRYYYDGSDDAMQKIVTSATPYDFEAENLGLIIEDGEILGIYSVSKPNYSVVQGYKAIERFYSFISCGEDDVTVPEITKFAHNPATDDGKNIDHDTLAAAIANMQSLTSYKLDFQVESRMASGRSVSGYIETVVDGDYYFEPYTGETTKTMQLGSEYGYHRITYRSYNSYSYNSLTGEYTATRAFDGDISKAKASFAFAAEIFTMEADDIIDGKETKIYFVNETLCHVASTFYCGMGNDAPLYGLYAMYYQGLGDYYPYVVVQDGYITQSGFFYFLGDMFGNVRINYSDFNTAELPESLTFQGFVSRTPPVGWDQLFVIDQTIDGDDKQVNALEFLTEILGEDVKNLPFFNEVLHDTYGFGFANYYSPGGTTRNVEAVILYYDVPLDGDRTIDSWIKATQAHLLNNGFTKNNYGEYVNGDVSVLPVDNSLDFCIYVWKTVK